MSKNNSINNSKPLIVQYDKKRNIINELYYRFLGVNKDEKNKYKKLKEDDKSSEAKKELTKVFEKNEEQNVDNKLINDYNKVQEQFAKEISPSPQKKWWHFFRKKSEFREADEDVKKYADIEFDEKNIGGNSVTTLKSLSLKNNQGKNTAIKMQMYDANGNTNNDLSIVVGIDKKGTLFISAPADIVIDDKTKLDDPVKIRRGDNYYFMPINYFQYRDLHNSTLGKKYNSDIAGINDLARKHLINRNVKNNILDESVPSFRESKEYREIVDKDRSYKNATVTYGVTRQSEAYCYFVEEGNWSQPNLNESSSVKLDNSPIKQEDGKNGYKYYMPKDISDKLEGLKNEIGFSNQISFLIGDYKSLNENNYPKYEWEKIEEPIITSESIKKTFTGNEKKSVEVTFKSLPGDRAQFMLEDIQISKSSLYYSEPVPIAIKMPIYDSLGKEVTDLNIVVGINKNGNKFVYKNGGEIILDGVTNIDSPVKMMKDNQNYHMPISYKQYENFYNEMYKNTPFGNSKIISNSIEKNSRLEKNAQSIKLEAANIGSTMTSQDKQIYTKDEHDRIKYPIDSKKAQAIFDSKNNGNGKYK
jgi:hypothetical protein